MALLAIMFSFCFQIIKKKRSVERTMFSILLMEFHHPGMKSQTTIGVYFHFLNISGLLTVEKKNSLWDTQAFNVFRYVFFFLLREIVMALRMAHIHAKVCWLYHENDAKTSVSVAHIGLNWKWIYAIVCGVWFNAIH